MTENDRFKYFPNLILIYCGVLLSLSFKSISDSLILVLDKSSCLQDFITNIPTINYLFILLLIYFIDDILDMLSFLSINPYIDSLRFYMDILINTAFYFCILLIINKSAFFLIGLVSVFFFTILWCIVCLYQKADNTDYLKFNIVIHFYGSLAILYLYFFAGYCYSIINDQIAWQYLIIFLIWVLVYEILRIVILRKADYKGTGFIPSGIILIIFNKIVKLILLVKDIHKIYDKKSKD